MKGAILGDIAGSAYEFHNTKDYNFPMFAAGSDITDDSLMTWAVARWLMEDPDHTGGRLAQIMEEIGRRYPNPVGGYGAMFGIWLFSRDKRDYGSWGNGSAMRVSPVGWAFGTLEETERVAGISAAVSHSHPEGIKGAQAVADAVWMARNGRTKEEIRSFIGERFGYDLHRSWEDIRRTYGWEASCQKTVPEALVAFLDSTDFEDALRKAISMGGDSDTVGAITGAVAEAFYGGVPDGMWKTAEARCPELASDFVPAFGKWVAENSARTAGGRKAPDAASTGR